MDHADLTAWINTQALRDNLAAIRQVTGPGVALCVAGKANAYGHDVRIVVPVLNEAGVAMIATATLDEAIEVRRLNWPRQILCLGVGFALSHGTERADRIAATIENDLSLSPTTPEDLTDLNIAAGNMRRVARVHVNVETGMGRLGLLADEAFELCRLAVHLRHIRLEGVYTHLANAEAVDTSSAHHQLDLFRTFTDRIQAADIHVPYLHAANSAATLAIPESRFDMVRPGLAVYGYRPGANTPDTLALKPALKLTSRISLIKDVDAGQPIGYGSSYTTTRPTRVGVIPVGYNDGYLRSLSNRGTMTIDQQRLPVLGRVSMDSTVVDLTHVPEPRVGQEITVISDDPTAPNSADNLAKLMDTLSYEVTCLVGHRAQRRAFAGQSAAASSSRPHAA